MSVFTNSASRSQDDSGSYVDAVLDLLGDRDPLAVLRATAAEVALRMEGISTEALTRPEREGKWSMRHVVRHLADSEIAWSWRLRVVLSQDRPPLPGYDQDAWAAGLHYDEADAGQALTEFRMLREANLRLLERASPLDFARVGIHAERGEESVAFMMKLYAGHDLLHLGQLDRIRAVVG